MRPTSVGHFYGQSHLLGEERILARLLMADKIPSLLFWGPPGTGKTSLARIISSRTGGFFVFFSAVLSGVKEIRKIVAEAERRVAASAQRTILFVDEIHRFNKGQQDAFLPHVESGLLTLIGATTENPSFHVIAPLISRCRVLVLEPLSHKDLRAVFLRALQDSENGLGEYGLHIDDEAMRFLVEMSDGDARKGLNILEISAGLLTSDKGSPDARTLSVGLVEEAAQQKTLRYDKDGEEHYNLISALHKSLRDSDPDGSLYWFYRMLDAGEDPLYISRRLIRFASEDIGVADPHALVQANASRAAFQSLGSPEGELAIAQTVVYLATAPKSNSVYAATKEVRSCINKTGSLPVPLQIRNAPTKLMKELGYGKGYQYAHAATDALVEQDHMPEALVGTRFYEPTNRGYESVIKERISKWRKLLEKKKL
jgi:putative ATPase